MNHKPYLYIKLTYQSMNIPIIIKRSITSKKISLKACFKIYGGKVTIPNNLPFKQGKQFAELNLPKLYLVLKKCNRVNISQLKEIYILGNNIQIKQSPNTSTQDIDIKITSKELIIAGSIENTTKLNQAFRKFVIEHTKAYLKKFIDSITQQLDITYNKVSLKYLTSKWGSCSILKNINFNWRLAFAPIKVINYVAIHEVAHLVYFNHSKNFWNLVSRLHPTYKEEKVWLKKYGYTLYKIQL